MFVLPWQMMFAILCRWFLLIFRHGHPGICLLVAVHAATGASISIVRFETPLPSRASAGVSALAFPEHAAAKP